MKGGGGGSGGGDRLQRISLGVIGVYEEALGGRQIILLRRRFLAGLVLNIVVFSIGIGFPASSSNASFGESLRKKIVRR